MKSGGMHAAVRDVGTLFSEGAVGLLPDGQLLDRFVGRSDASAFEAIVGRYGPLVWGVCRRVLRDHHDAEDAFQATFLVLARKAASVRPREKLGNWLYGVAYQTAMKARATRAKRQVRERPVREATEPEADPDEQADERLARLDREVSLLPDKYRLPVVLCELEGKTHRQAAEQLGWPVGTVSGRLSRAKVLLARRLSRPGATLTAGALTSLLAHDAARAGVPPELIVSTAQAAGVSTAGKAVTAGVVSAGVAALTGEVLKTMLLNKLKAITATLLAAFALAAGGITLTYRAHATAVADQERGSQKPNEPPNAAGAVEGERPRLLQAAEPDIQGSGYRPKSGESPEEDTRRPEDPKRVAAEETKPSLPITEKWWQGSHQRKLECGGYSFTALRAGDAALAYNAATREVKAVRLHATKEQPLWVTPVAVESSSDDKLVALGVQGDRITRVAVFNLKSGKWTPLDLDPPVKGNVWPIPFGHDTAAYEVGELLYLYNPKTDAWDRLDLRTITDDRQEPRAARGR